MEGKEDEERKMRKELGCAQIAQGNGTKAGHNRKGKGGFVGGE